MTKILREGRKNPVISQGRHELIEQGLRLFIPLLLLWLIGTGLRTAVNPPKSDQRLLWADSVMAGMDLTEQIGQLFMIQAYSNRGPEHTAFIDSIITRYKPGGICMFQGHPSDHMDRLNHWQAMSELPMLVAMDAEWGPSMRLDSLPVFPRQITQGAIRSDSLTELMGVEIARQLKILGVHLNFAPVVDVNNNPNNPVIGNRSFGESPWLVADKSLAYIRGLRRGGILSTAKHFPGHGDTEKDSHLTLPSIKASYKELDSIHLYPFRAAFTENVDAVMTGHLFIPAIDNRPGRAVSMSKAGITGLLRDSMHFQGIVVSDALGMKGVADYFAPGELSVQAFLAGNDVLLFPPDMKIAMQAMLDAVRNGVIDSSLIAASCRRILAAKYDAGLHHFSISEPRQVTRRINEGNSDAIIAQMYRSALTLIRNYGQTLPLSTARQKKVAVITIGSGASSNFTDELSTYLDFTSFRLPQNPSYSEIKRIVSKLDAYDISIISIHSTRLYAGNNYGVAQSTIDLIRLASASHSVVLNIAGSPYILSRLPVNDNIKVIMLSYEDHPEAGRAAAMGLCGAIRVDGRLPVSSGRYFPRGMGLELPKTILAHVNPQVLGIHPEDLAGIDSIALEGIMKSAYPGCRVLLARDGWIFYDKSFGSHTYDKKSPVRADDLYDLASLTKIAASTLALMRLSDEGLIDVDRTLGYYLEDVRGSNKENIVIREMMAHMARLVSWIPFYAETLPVSDTSIYSSRPGPGYSLQVASGVYIRDDYPDTMMRRVIDSDLEWRKRYLYSDIGYYLLQQIIEQVSHVSLDAYVDSVFYSPMGLRNISYRPLEHYSADRIPPTEKDVLFRKQLVHGYVHDPGAAMMGGVAGHAGLFSDAMDLAAIMQLFLDGGVYGGVRYIKESTLAEFTRQQFPLNHNRRAIGFDRPPPGGGGQTCKEVSSSSYGHSGFTGTYAWVDPRDGLVYIFLSNRIYPDAENLGLLRLSTRTRIHSQAFKALRNAGPALPR